MPRNSGCRRLFALLSRSGLLAALVAANWAGHSRVLSDDDPPTTEPAEADKPDAEKAESKAEKPAQKQGPAARNPLTDLIKRTLRPGAANGPLPGIPLPNTPDGASKRNPERHNVDPRAPYQRKTSDWLYKAAGLAKAEQWKEALELLQRVTDQPEDSLYQNESKTWVSVWDEADRLRGQAPPSVLADYRVQFGGLARQLLLDATRTGSMPAFARVARGYFHTDAGYEAADRLGSAHLDRGEFALAGRWFAALWRAKAPATAEPAWRIKAAYALKQAGQLELSRQIVPPDADETPGSARLDSVEVGGLRRQAAQWLANVTPLSLAAESPLSDWLVFLGTPRRNGVAQGGEPLLLPRWHVPLTASEPAHAAIDLLVDDLSSAKAQSPSMLFPTMVDGRIAFRTLHGVQVIDAATGRILWDTESHQPLEKSIGAGGQSFEGGDGLLIQRQMAIRMAMDGRGIGGAGEGEFGPLCNLLFRNASFGIVSSDGRQLFVVDDPAFLTSLRPWENNFQWDGAPTSLPTPGSKLTSYDLSTGRPLWEAGGPAWGEPFDPPLAGYFFFGAPIVDGGELFAVGESTAGETAGQVRLLALDSQTGQVKWSQLLAYSDPAAIDKDVRRRLWGAPVAVDSGVLVCPTTVGWLVAVDRVTHSLLWGYRPAAPGQNQARMAAMPAEQHELQAMVQDVSLASSWSPSPPMLAQGKVVYASQETQTLVCLDQFTGQLAWSKPRNAWMYVAGLFDGKVLIVGRDSTQALDLAGGNVAWTLKTPVPAGRGVAISGRYELPLSTGEIWSVNLADGQVAGRCYLPEHAGRIGNLAMYRGMLLSMDASGLTAFEQRDAVRELVEARKRVNPGDAWALVREAEISALAHEYPAALAALEQLSADRTPADLAERRRSLLIESLRAVIRADFNHPQVDARMRELEQALRSGDETRGFRRLQADLFVHRGEFAGAFETCLELARSEPEEMVGRDDFPDVQVRGRQWASGKLADLFATVPAEAREPFDRRVTEMAQAALERPVAEQAAFVDLFPWHAAAIPVRRWLVDGLIRAGELAHSEHLLLELSRSSDPAVAAPAVERLARLLADSGLPSDSAVQYLRLERDFRDVPIDSGQTAGQLVQALRNSGRFPVGGAAVGDWHADGLRIERMGASYVQYVPQELLLGGNSSPYFSRQHFEFNPAGQRLEMTDLATDELKWSLPLRFHSASADAGAVVGRSSGHLLNVLHRGVVHCLSPVDRRVLWTRALDAQAAKFGYNGRNMHPLQPMQTAIRLDGRQSSQQNMQAGTASLIANESYICCQQGRRDITVLDVRSGEPLWTCTGIPFGALVFGGRNVIYVRPSDGPGGLALRAADGKRLEIPQLAETLARAVHAVGDRFVLTSTSPNKTTLRLFDPLTQTDVWTIELAGKSMMSLIDDDRLAILEPGSEGSRFQLLDLATGQAQLLGTLAPEDLKGRTELFALADNQNVYLLVNKTMNHNFWSEQVPFVRTNGQVFAFDPLAAKLRWKQQVQGQNLMLERLDCTPFLVFAAHKQEQRAKLNFFALHLVVIDKMTGNRLLDDKSASQPGFRSVTVSNAERYVELRSWNDRIRLYPVEKPKTTDEAGGG